MSGIQNYLTSNVENRLLSSNSVSLSNSTIIRDNKLSSNSINISIKVEVYPHNNLVKELINMNSFLYDIFINQRKMYRYYKAVTEFEEKLLDEDSFEDIEKSCTINLKNYEPREIKDKLIYLYDLIKGKNEEELKYMYDDELADILAISQYNLKPLLEKI